MSNLYFTKVIPIFDMAKFFHSNTFRIFLGHCSFLDVARNVSTDFEINLMRIIGFYRIAP